MKYLFIILLFFSLGAEAQNYTFQKTDCRLEILIGAQIRYSMQLDELTWTNRIGGIEVKDGVSSLYCNGSQITNYTGGQVDSLILDLTTWRLACITRVVSDTLFIGSDTIISGTGYPRDSLSADSDSLYWYQNGVYKDGFSFGGGGGAFATAANVTSNSPGTIATDDFVFGSDQLNDDGDATHDNRMIFDKSIGFFGAGKVTGTDWDLANRGNASAAFGSDNEVSGNWSIASGTSNNVTSTRSAAFGGGNTASINYSYAFGTNCLASGTYSFAFGSTSIASATGSVALGGGATASGNYSLSAGLQIYAKSYTEIALGTYNTIYTPVSTTAYSALDRQFVVGNGTGAGASSSDAFTILKGGEVGIGIDSLESNSTGELLQVAGNTRTDTLTVIYPKTGWAQYTDTLYTVASPLTINAGDTVTLSNRAHTKIETYLPSTVTELYNGTTYEINGELGSSYNVRVDFVAENNNVSGNFDIIFDIGADDNNPIIILERVSTFPKGANTQTQFSITTSLYALSTFVTNGCRVRILGNTGTTLINNLSIMIVKTTHAE